MTATPASAARAQDTTPRTDAPGPRPPPGRPRVLAPRWP